RAAEHVVVGDRDRPEPLAFGVREQVGHVDRAVVRPRGVEVEVADDPLTAGQRLVRSCDATSFRQLAVEPVVLTRKVPEGLSLRSLAVLASLPLAKRVVFGEAGCG